MIIIRLLVVGFLFILIPEASFAEHFSTDSTYDICFTPENNCANKIIEAIKQAKKQILVQAYAFTDASIAQAFVKAKARGVDVRIILDKSQPMKKRSRAIIRYLSNNKIKPLMDFISNGIAHNKVIIIDSTLVIGGSYNYTFNAAKRNAENIIIIKDPELAKKYIQNWHGREKKSSAISDL